MTAVALRLDDARAQVARHALELGRDPAGIRLVAVSKTRPASDVAAALAAGQVDFGENYLQEALAKMAAPETRGATWHFIGRVQSNKTRELAARFDWVQTVDRERIAIRLDEQRPADLPPLNICLQVNVDEEAQKAGLAPTDVAAVARAVAPLSRLRLRGLMAIPAASSDFEQQRASFARVRALFDALNAEGFGFDTLSIGMSGDLRAAIAAGSTMVRIGTAIFGARG